MPAALRLGFWAVVGGAIYYTGTWLPFLLFWVVPFVTSFQMIRYFGEMAEHAGLQSTSPWMGSRVWTSCLPVRWLIAPHNDEMHLTQRLFPRIPHYRIRQAHNLLMQVLSTRQLTTAMGSSGRVGRTNPRVPETQFALDHAAALYS